MELTRFTTPSDFLARAESFLMAHEALHTVPLGVARSLVQKPDLYEVPSYFAVVEDAGAVQVAALMTPPHGLLVSYTVTPAAFPPLAADVWAFRPDTPWVSSAQPWSEQFAQAWQAHTGQPYQLKVAERLYQLTQVIAPTGVPGAMRRATEMDRPLLVAWTQAFYREAMHQEDETQVQRTVQNFLTLPPAMRSAFVWEVAGQPVSLTSYGGRTPNTMRVGPVYTPPAQRGHGYASACVAATSQYLLDGLGVKTCVLFTDLSNPTSNKIYQALGYAPVCNVDVFQFGAVAAH